MNIATLTLQNKSPISIYYIGQFGTSGYAQAARGYLFDYFSRGIPITWEPLYFDDSKLNNDDLYDIVIKSLIYKDIEDYNMVILHSTPDLWPTFWIEKYNKLKDRVVNGYCTWETSILPKPWVKNINSTVNEVWCPSNYNKTIFSNSGVNIPIRVVPHIFLPKQLPEREKIVLIDSLTGEQINNSGRYTFYSIGEFNARKGISELLHTYCQTFTDEDNVQLIIKTHYKSYSPENIGMCRTLFDDILKEYSNPPRIICLLGNMSSDEMLALHSLGDCYISLTKSEGFGLTIFDAFNYGKKIIVTNGGGHLDFLGTNYSGLVDAKIGKVEGMDTFNTMYSGAQDWFIPDLDHASYLMKKISNL